MIYEFRCEETGETIEKEMSMNDEIPVTFEENGKTYKRVFSSVATHIPEGWGENQFKFDKSPSGRKRFF